MREDHFTNTPEDATRYEARRANDWEAMQEDRPTLTEAARDELFGPYLGEYGDFDEDYGAGPQEPRREVEPEPRPCPECEQGKHAGCDNLALDSDDRLVPCPCATRGHR